MDASLTRASTSDRIRTTRSTAASSSGDNPRTRHDTTGHGRQRERRHDRVLRHRNGQADDQPLRRRNGQRPGHRRNSDQVRARASGRHRRPTPSPATTAATRGDHGLARRRRDDDAPGHDGTALRAPARAPVSGAEHTARLRPPRSWSSAPPSRRPSWSWSNGSAIFEKVELAGLPRTEAYLASSQSLPTPMSTSSGGSSW